MCKKDEKKSRPFDFNIKLLYSRSPKREHFFDSNSDVEKYYRCNAKRITDKLGFGKAFFIYRHGKDKTEHNTAR